MRSKGFNMTDSQVLKIIYDMAVKKMHKSEDEAAQYVGLVVAFNISRLNFNNSLTDENLKVALLEEVEFHLKASDQDVA